MSDPHLVQLCRRFLAELVLHPDLFEGADPAMLLAEFVGFVANGAQAGAGRSTPTDALRIALYECGYDPDNLCDATTSIVRNGKIIIG